MNATQIEYLLKRIDEETERKREAIKEKYPIPFHDKDGKPRNIRLGGMADFEFEKLKSQIEDAIKRRDNALLNLEATAKAVKDYCILGPGGDDAYEQIKNFIREEF